MSVYCLKKLNILKFKDIVKLETYIIAQQAYNNQLLNKLQQFIKKYESKI